MIIRLSSMYLIFITLSFILTIVSGACKKRGDNPTEIHTPQAPDSLQLGHLLQATDEWAIADLPLTTLAYDELPLEIPALGFITTDTRFVGVVAARVSGRIERLYLRYVYQPVKKGQKILDLYSPELVTAQENILFLWKNDPENNAMIEAARQRLLLLGFSESELADIRKSGKPKMTTTIYSPYSGFIRNPGEDKIENENMAGATTTSQSANNERLMLSEGAYIEAGASIVNIWDNSRVWVQLQISPPYQALAKVGNPVRIVPETRPDEDFRATIDYLEPFFDETSKTLNARVYLSNQLLKLPLGSPVKATIFGNKIKGYWLPSSAVVHLGIEQVVFIKRGHALATAPVKTGSTVNEFVQITFGLSPTDSVAVNGQYLMDSESFIKIPQQ